MLEMAGLFEGSISDPANGRRFTLSTAGNVEMAEGFEGFDHGFHRRGGSTEAEKTETRLFLLSGTSGTVSRYEALTRGTGSERSTKLLGIVLAAAIDRGPARKQC